MSPNTSATFRSHCAAFVVSVFPALLLFSIFVTLILQGLLRNTSECSTTMSPSAELAELRTESVQRLTSGQEMGGDAVCHRRRHSRFLWEPSQFLRVNVWKMLLLLRKDFADLFDIVITNALKPGFFSHSPRQRPFHTLSKWHLFLANSCMWHLCYPQHHGRETR